MAADKKASGALRQVLAYIRRYWVFLGVSLLLAAATVALTLYVPVLTGDAVDLLLGKGQVDFAAVFAIMRRIAVAIAVTALAQWGMNICNNHITYHVVKDIREDAFSRIQELPLKYLDAHAYGDIVSRVIADVDTFADGLLMGFTQLFTGVLTIGGTLVFMLATNVPIALVVIGIPCLSCSRRREGSRLPSSRKWWATRRSLRPFPGRRRWSSSLRRSTEGWKSVP